MLFDLLLRVLGWLFVLRLRSSSRFRAQITRDTVIQISAGSKHVHHFVFAPGSVARRSGPAQQADVALAFDSPGLGLRCFLSPHILQKLFDNLQAGRIETQGNLYLLLWFQGLAQQVFPLARVPALPATPPEPYVKHAPGPAVAARITREPVADELDPEWQAAHEARGKTFMVRVARGEKPPLF